MRSATVDEVDRIGILWYLLLLWHLVRMVVCMWMLLMLLYWRIEGRVPALRHHDRGSKPLILIARILIDVARECEGRHKHWPCWIRLQAGSIAANFDSTAGAACPPYSSLFFQHSATVGAVQRPCG